MVVSEESRDDASGFETSSNYKSKDVIDGDPKRASFTESSRVLHQEKVLKLCEEKLIASKESKAIVAAIKDLYKEKVLPIEMKYHLHSLCLPTQGAIQDAEFHAKPMVLLLGQYSVGKSSFCKYLVGRDFPGIRVGPEPTTDRFNPFIVNDHITLLHTVTH